MRHAALTFGRRVLAGRAASRAARELPISLAHNGSNGIKAHPSSSLGVIHPTLAGFTSSASASASSSFGASARAGGAGFAAGSIVFAAGGAAIVNLAMVNLADVESLPRAKEALPKAKLPFEKVVLYQYDVCPFCNKVKAMLDFHGIPYDVVEVNPLTKSELGFSEYKKVPVLMIDDEQFNDSSHIMKTLDDKMGVKGWMGKGKAAEDKEAKWAAWVDDRFVHVVTPNIYRTWAEAWRSFDYITERGNFGPVMKYAIRVAGATSMYNISHYVLKKRHGIEDERAELYKALDDWMTNAVGKEAFCGGSAPNVADLAVFGVLRAVKTFDTFTDAIENTDVGPWYKRMQKEVGVACRTDGIEN